MRFATMVPAVVASLLIAAPAVAGDKASLLASTGKALEDQLACLVPPKPALAIRAMMRNGLLVKTRFDADGSPVFRPTSDLLVFGKRVLFVTGWEMEGDQVKQPFWRGPGTEPPLFLAVTLDAAPAEIPYQAHMVRGSDGTAVGSFSSIEPTREFYSSRGTTITCYGG